MNAINSIDTSVLDGIIVGRVDPHIYAFSTETIPNYLKVGDTYRAVEVRLDEWRKHFPKLIRIYDHTARIDDRRIFRDYSVHTFLENERNRKRLKKNLFPKEYYSNEFFERATKKDVEDAIADICRDAERNAGKYQFYDENHLPETYTYERKDDYKPRKNQQETIEKFKVAVDKGRKKLLMYAVMRFGKSFTSMCCADEINADLVVVVSAKADVKEEWKKTVESHKRFVHYEFATSDNLKSNKKFISESKGAGKKIVLFLTLQDLQGKEMKDKHNELFETTIDLLLVDESHFGARASEYGRVLQDYKLTIKQLKAERQKEVSLDELGDGLKVLRANVTMHLSGTPYRILMSDEFTDDDIVAFYQFSDIAVDKEKWDMEHIDNDDVKEWNNPYYGFPQMVRFAFNPSQSVVKKLNALKKDGVSYAMSELLKPQSILKDEKNNAHKRFVHTDEVLDLLKVIDGSKADENVLGFLDYDKIKQGQMCRHIVIVLPFRASCDAFEEMIADNKEIFKNLKDYQIVNIAGVDGDKKFKDIKDIKNKIQTCEAKGQKTITLTVNRMLTGSTVEQWDTMIYLKETESPQEYDQAIFRLQNPYVKVYGEGSDAIRFNMKPQTLLVDFDVNRVFRMQEQKSHVYNVNTCAIGNSSLRSRIQKELEISPIIVINKDRLQRVEPAVIMDAVREYSRSKSVADEANDIPTDFSLLDNERLRAAIEKLAPIDAKKGLEIKPKDGDDDFELPLTTGKKKNSGDCASVSSLDKNDEKKELAKKLATYYSQILFYAFLTESKVESLADIINDVDENNENKRICRNVGLSKSILQTTQECSNPIVLRMLDYKIQNINTLICDENLKPIDRVETAMRKFGRLGTSEIVTPADVADKMVALLPEDYKNRKVKILDIASKQGEFTTALYRRFGDNVKNSIYALPTSRITYEFTLKVYKLLGMPTRNVYDNFTCFDLLNENKDKYIKQLLDMKFDAIVGNPPYQETKIKTSDKPVYHLFMETSFELAERVTLITPARYLFNAGKTPKNFNKRVLNDEHFKVVWYKPNSNDVFQNVSIPGGVAVMFWDKKAIFGKIGIFTAFKELNGIYNKVTYNEEFISIKNSIYLQNKFNMKQLFIEHPNVKLGSEGKEKRMTTSIFSLDDIFLSTQKRESDIRILGLVNNTREYRWIESSLIEEHPNLNKWKVLIPKSNGSGAIGEVASTQIIGEPLVGEPFTGYTQSFISIGIFETEAEANAALKYVKTKFARFMLGTMKATQDNNKDTWENVPLQDFTSKSDINWSKSVKEIDEQLYKKYGLTEEEVKFVEGMVKEME